MTELLTSLCPCGCGKTGLLQGRRRGDGYFHVRRCPCRRCVASRVRKRAGNRERQIARTIGGTREVLSGALSGADVIHSRVRIEETANVSLTRGLRRWWESKQTEAKVLRLFGDELPGAFVASWDGSPRVVVMPYEGFVRLLTQDPEVPA
jgi:hypothetical protein